MRTWDLPELGVGMTYTPALENLLQADPNLVDVLEIEPQTVWLETGDTNTPYKVFEDVLAHLEALPAKKLVHSVGVPVGGTVRPEASQLKLLELTIQRLRSPWVSEHLSFNHTPQYSTGFFLPPRQTAEGVEGAARAIRDLQDAFSVPVAVETGVNYLRTRDDEYSDGAFVAEVVTKANCGIVLDLHNIFANALNGRQSMDDFVSQLPLDRVWEVHIAGGFELEGYWLDAHSGAVPDELLQSARRLVQHLPNLRAIIFEIFPAFIPLVGERAIIEQIKRLRELWELRGQRAGEPLSGPAPKTPSRHGPSPAVWEQALGSLVIGREPSDETSRELAADPGVRLIERLAQEFRASMVVNVYRLTSRLLMLSLGGDAFRLLLEDFWSKYPPHLYAATEANNFMDHLLEIDLPLPQLRNLINLERAVLATLTDGVTRVVSFPMDPFPLLRALADGRLPDMVGQVGEYEIELTADGVQHVIGTEERWLTPVASH